jgi:hypothetical protein
VADVPVEQRRDEPSTLEADPPEAGERPLEAEEIEVIAP